MYSIYSSWSVENMNEEYLGTWNVFQACGWHAWGILLDGFYIFKVL